MMKIKYDFEPKFVINDFIFNKNNVSSNDFVSLNELQTEVENRLKRIPKEILKIVNKEDWLLIITNKRNLESEYNIDFKVYGITDFEKKELIVYAQKDPIMFSIPHEFGHIVDKYFNNISKTNDWIKIANKYVASVVDGNSYFTSTDSSEFFADCIAAYCLQINKRIFDSYKMNDIFDIIERMLKIAPYVEQQSEKETSVSESEKMYNKYCNTRVSMNQDVFW